MQRRRFLISAGASSLVLACDPRAAAVHTTSKTLVARGLRAVVGGVAHTDGAGVKLTKLLGHRQLAMLDPFLMLDRFRSSVAADFERGFPDHPHRGFETVSIVLDGHVRHADSVGNRGDIVGGGVQWMTAGKGIVHSEMLAAGDQSGELWGYQLWINLPKAQKMTAPRYQDLQAVDIPVITEGDARVRVLAGRVGEVRGPIDGVAAAPALLDVSLEPGARFSHPLPAGHTAFVVVASGGLDVGGRVVADGALGVFGAGDRVEVSAVGATRALLFAAAPIGEPVARRGPFVMNTEGELDQAYADYRSGRLVGG